MEIIIQFLADAFVRIFPDSPHARRNGGDSVDASNENSRASEVASYIKAIAWLLLFLVVGAAVIIAGANLLLSL